MRKAVIIIASILLILAGCVVIVRYSLDMREAKEIYEETDDTFTDYVKEGKVIISVDDDEGEDMVASTLSMENEPVDNVDRKSEADDSYFYSFRYSGDWEKQIDVDIESLIKRYPEVRGWLFFENENISYPIAQGVNDDKYLKTAYNGEITSSGSIFMETLNMPDFSDSHIIIYGHNMANRTMFGALRNYLNKPKYYDYHKYFQIIYLNSEGKIVKNRYKVFAYGKVKSYSKIYTVCRQHDANFAEVIQYIQGNFTMPADISVYDSSNVVTLSTCSIGENRIAVSAVLDDQVVMDE